MRCIITLNFFHPTFDRPSSSSDLFLSANIQFLFQPVLTSFIMMFAPCPLLDVRLSPGTTFLYPSSFPLKMFPPLGVLPSCSKMPHGRENKVPCFSLLQPSALCAHSVYIFYIIKHELPFRSATPSLRCTHPTVSFPQRMRLFHHRRGRVLFPLCTKSAVTRTRQSSG